MEWLRTNTAELRKGGKKRGKEGERDGRMKGGSGEGGRGDKPFKVTWTAFILECDVHQQSNFQFEFESELHGAYYDTITTLNHPQFGQEGLSQG